MASGGEAEGRQDTVKDGREGGAWRVGGGGGAGVEVGGWGWSVTVSSELALRLQSRVSSSGQRTALLSDHKT